MNKIKPAQSEKTIDKIITELQNQLKEAEALISLIASPVEFYCEVGERSKQEAALSYQSKYMNKSGEDE